MNGELHYFGLTALAQLQRIPSNVSMRDSIARATSRNEEQPEGGRVDGCAVRTGVSVALQVEDTESAMNREPTGGVDVRAIQQPILQEYGE